ncbi:hypothetical protein F5B20DRAFT_563532 [Whalleya microplaca]|nr:hypothetical protein F5B20DRAFT_563532 [Whalleya microplaca]
MNLHALATGTLFGPLPHLHLAVVHHHNLPPAEPVISDYLFNDTITATSEEVNTAHWSTTPVVTSSGENTTASKIIAEMIGDIHQRNEIIGSIFMSSYYARFSITTTEFGTELRTTDVGPSQIGEGTAHDTLPIVIVDMNIPSAPSLASTIGEPETTTILLTREIGIGTHAVSSVTSAPTPEQAINNTHTSISPSMVFETDALSLAAMMVTAPSHPQMTPPSSGSSNNSTGRGVTSVRPRQPEPAIISENIPSSPNDFEYFRHRGWPTVSGTGAPATSTSV